MFNRILWTIDNLTDWKAFERLCLSLLDREGFRNLVPVEPPDGGRDAEGIDPTGERCFIQFSLQARWKKKLLDDIATVCRARHPISRFVFVSSRKIGRASIDKIAREIRANHELDLVVFSREWLRFRLEEKDPDLAARYLGVSPGEATPTVAASPPVIGASFTQVAVAWHAFESGDFQHAAADLERYLGVDSRSSSAWLALAWSQYRLCRYDEAAHSVRQAEKHGARSDDVRGVRACILAERGILRHDAASLMEAERLFRESAEHSPNALTHYNLGNVLTALGRHHDAIDSYKRSLQLDSGNARAWKNLASTYHRIGDHDAEMRCFDRALEIDPLLIEGLVSKGVSLLIDFSRPADAIDLLERAMSQDPGFPARWPDIWYWLASAHFMAERSSDAMRWANEGLLHQPGYAALRDLKSRILVRYSRESPHMSGEAEKFWKEELRLCPENYQVREYLVGLLDSRGRIHEAWETLEESFAIIGLGPTVPLRDSTFSLKECAVALRFLPFYGRFRSSCPIARYWDTSHELYDLDVIPPEYRGLREGLATFLAVPFGIALHSLLETPSASRNAAKALRDFYPGLRRQIEKGVSEAAGYAAPDLQGKDSKSIAAGVAAITTFLALWVALREFGAQRGWIAGRMGYSTPDVEQSYAGFDETLIVKNTLRMCLETLNRYLTFSPPPDRAEPGH